MAGGMQEKSQKTQKFLSLRQIPLKSYITLRLRNHPDGVHSFECCRANRACHPDSYFVAIRQEVDHIAPLELHHKVRYAVLVMIAPGKGPLHGGDGPFHPG